MCSTLTLYLNLHLSSCHKHTKISAARKKITEETVGQQQVQIRTFLSHCQNKEALFFKLFSPLLKLISQVVLKTEFLLNLKCISTKQVKMVNSGLFWRTKGERIKLKEHHPHTGTEI